MTKNNLSDIERLATLRGDGGVLMSARNGDVIQYDDSGLILRLSDKVILDIAARLAALGPSGAVSDLPEPVHPSPAPRSAMIDADVLGDIDAWHVTQDEGWFLFQANLANSNGPRGYRRPVEGGDIIADAPGAVLGMLSIGGPRRAVGFDTVGDFGYHVVAPNDDIGAVGLAASDLAKPAGGFSALREQTRDSLIAQAVLRARAADNRALPLIMARCEADQSGSSAALANGVGFDNFIVAAQTLLNVSKSMGKSARILAVGLDYCIEDTVSTGTAYRDGIYALMGAIEVALGQLGFRKPCFVSHFECGGAYSDVGCHTQEQWELATNPAGFNLVYSAPGYMFEQTIYGRPTPRALVEMAEMDAYAIEACEKVPRTDEERAVGVGQWCCPNFLLAERVQPTTEDGPQTIRVTGNALSGLVVDHEADFGSPEFAGFWLENVQNGAQLTGVRVCPDNPLDILLDCDMTLEGDAIRLHYACGRTAQLDDLVDQLGYAVNRGCIRDGWQAKSAGGRQLYRWALPCILPVH